MTEIMKISYEWIRKYVPTKIRASKLAEALTMNGLEVVDTEQKKDDHIFDIEITPNRPDWLSHIGIAREVSAITKKSLKLPQVKIDSKHILKNISKPKVFVEDSSLCPHYSARVFEGVKVGTSPKWLIKRVESIGLRPVNNIVDITNFVLHETGQPLHAFDYDKLNGGTIIVRKAKKGEEITTIDGKTRKLKENTLVIADSKKVVAVAGVMGGIDTEVSFSTKRILLESAYFNPLSVRRTARGFGISTDSSYRFERGVDPEAVLSASKRAASLICEIAHAKTDKRVIELGANKRQEQIVALRPKRASLVLGVELDADKIISYLSPLGFHGTVSGNSLKIKIPSFRADDITREADLIEELARAYGYDNIPAILPSAIPTQADLSYAKKEEVRKIAHACLQSAGFSEVLSYTLIAEKEISSVNMPDTNTISIINPLSEQQAVMRNTLLPGVLGALSHNLNMGNNDVRIFEDSGIYFREKNNLREGCNLAIALCGDAQKDWNEQVGRLDLFYIKGAIEQMIKKLNILVKFEASHHPAFEPSETLAILSDHTMLGTLGRISSQVTEAIGVKRKIYAAEIDMQTIFDHAKLGVTHKTLPRFPGSGRDISMYAGKDIHYDSIEAEIDSAATLSIKNINLIEVYEGEQIPKGKRSLLVRVFYQLKDRTLTEAEVDASDKAIRESLVKNLNIELR